MASPVADLEAGLQAMLSLKPPGVSGSRITSLTSLCVANIEAMLIQKIYTHFKKAPGTHKLGVLYVVDSVTRKWLEQAKSQGQAINSSASDGTYAAGVNRVTELMPALMNDILQSCPEPQKEKIKKLLDIWEKGQTFPPSMVASFREQIAAPAPVSTTPPGSPPAELMASLQGRAPSSAPAPAGPAASAAPAVGDAQSILAALSRLKAGQENSSSQSAPNVPAPAPAYSIPQPGVSQATPPVAQSPWSQPPPQQPSTHQGAPSYPPSTLPGALPFNMPQIPGQQGLPAGMPSFPGNQTMPPFPGAAAPAMPPLPAAATAGIDPSIIAVIKTLSERGVPADQIATIVQSMSGAQGQQQPPAPQAPAVNPYGSWQTPAAKPDGWRGQSNGARSPGGSPRNGHGGRDSYGREDGKRDSPRGSRRGNDYRDRSPPRRRGDNDLPPPNNQWVDFDPELPKDHIKVFSRTLFVGGVTCPEHELRSMFSKYGTVQTCIVNKDKRHAFVKMISRKDAVAAKNATQDSRDTDMPLRTRWGVGFGPRDCSDYSSGVSIIPVHRLTEADVKWMLTAPYGGSGGREIKTGLVVEEPDIEIGAGVSSKAISRRMQTDKGGATGPKSTRHRESDSGWPRRDNNNNNNNRRDDDRSQQQQQQQPQQQQQGGNIPFPFGMGSLPSGMPNFPNGFFPDMNAGGQQGGWQR
ncbi:uncharacterized protein J7T54_007381 [Emericellopsis cladophorae]|uniref:RNA binding protein Nrd1 n=1 Tax=Emericellopsis cladophorae TaxID=2686198 RepID=A0A9P9Y084_9HYPO|nr:uncharacterized protein J7T54_007381 [Emericellopsis cladophorae]KAI6780901.1 hypothetical protein J7T54_007381 [Emericellopsis cladophorae]